MAKEGKSTVVPRLRFPEFRSDGPWESKPLSDLCERVNEKVGDLKLTPVSITAGRGYVSQAEKFGRDISGAQYKNYIHLRRGDFAYNKGNSNLYPQGCVYRLTEFDEAAASNAFICFRLLDGNAPGFFEGLFEKNAHGRQLTKFLTSGARSDGLLNIRPEEFFSVELHIPPCSAEQQKIADCLTSLNAVIATQGQKVEALKMYKRGLMQQLFPRDDETIPRVRFPEFRDEPEWEAKEIGEVFKVTRGEVLAMTLVQELRTSSAQYPVYSSQTKNGGLSGYYSDFLYEDAITWTTDGANAGDVNFRSGKFYCTNVCGVLLSTEGFANPCIAALINSVSRNHVSYIGNPKLMNGVMSKISVPFPPLAEQRRIADCLSALDAEIAGESRKLDALNVHKKGFMQQLFASPEEV